MFKKFIISLLVVSAIAFVFIKYYLPETTFGFNYFVSKMPHFEQVNEDTGNKKIKVGEIESKTNAAGTETCTVSEMLLSGANSEFFLLDPTTDVIYPGALLYGNSITTGEYTPIIGERAPITYSISLSTMNKVIPAATVSSPSLSSVRTSVNNLLSEMKIGSTPTYMSLTHEQIYSKNGLSRSIGVSYGDPVKALGGSITFEEGKETNKVIIKFVQKFYTLDLDFPQKPTDWFVKGTNLPSANSFRGSSPVFVSSVTYGRMALITIESTESYDNIIGTINASLSILPKEVLDEGGTAKPSDAEPGKIEASFSQEQRKIFNTFKIDMMVLGGSASNAANVLSINSIESYSQALSSFIKEGAEWSPENPGVMLSYKLRHLSDNSIANIVLADRYKVRDCSRNKIVFKFEMTKWNVRTNDTGHEAEIKGKIKAKLFDPNGKEIAEYEFWNKEATNIEENNIYTDFNTPMFTYEHAAKNENGDVSAMGYTLRLYGDGMTEIDNFTEGGKDDNLNAEAINVNLGDADLLLNPQEKILHFKGDGSLYVHFNISAL